MSRQIAAKTYTEPAATPAPEPPTAETLTEIKAKVEQVLNSNDQKSFDEVEVVHRAKMLMFKEAGKEVQGFDIRQCISELIDSGTIQEIKPEEVKPIG